MQTRRFAGLLTALALLSAGPGYALAQTQSTISYTYDALGRVSTVTYSGGANNGRVVTYTYDAAGNRVTSSSSGGAPPPTRSVTIVPLLGFALIFTNR